MKRSVAQETPVLLRFAPELARESAWGRLSEISSTAAVVSTVTRLNRREKLFLSFELAGERWKDLPVEVVWSEYDADGYCAATLSLLDIVESRRLARVLLDALAR